MSHFTETPADLLGEIDRLRAGNATLVEVLNLVDAFFEGHETAIVEAGEAIKQIRAAIAYARDCELPTAEEVKGILKPATVMDE